MVSKEELLNKNVIEITTYNNLLKYENRLITNCVPVIYNLRHIRKIFHIRKFEQDIFFGKKRDKLYNVFYLHKKSGGYRKIDCPCDRLKQIQKWINDNILCQIKTSDYAKGFKKGLSIVDNAKNHIGKTIVLNIDLKDFFPSIKYKDILKVFLYIGYRKDVAQLLTKLVTNNKNVLPQGSPASPSLSNIVLLKLDKRLSCLAKAWNCNYSRYADDITFSGNMDVKAILPIIKKIIMEEGYQINENKLRFQYYYQHQEVTGITVNNKMSISKKIRREIENAIYYCNKYGVENHMNYINCDKRFYKEHLYGIAYFTKMINKELGNNYINKLDQIFIENVELDK